MSTVSLDERIDGLERSCRRLARAVTVVAVGIVAVAIVLGVVALGPEVVAARRFILKGADDTVRATLGVGDEATELSLFDLNGRRQMMMSVQPDGSAHVNMGEDLAAGRISLDAGPGPGLALALLNGAAHLRLGTQADGSLGLTWSGRDGRLHRRYRFAPDGSLVGDPVAPERSGAP
jgi:hypothetical protein